MPTVISVRNLVKTYVAGLVPTANDSQNTGDKFPENISILQH